MRTIKFKCLIVVVLVFSWGITFAQQLDSGAVLSSLQKMNEYFLSRNPFSPEGKKFGELFQMKIVSQLHNNELWAISAENNTTVLSISESVKAMKCSNVFK